MKIAFRLSLLMLLTAVPAVGSARAAERLDLYQERAIVTGTGEATRQAGFASALESVFAKVSGDARLIGDPKVATLAKDAGSLVASFTYRARMEGIPFHDEQGSRDRPHDLTVTFDGAKIDAALRTLGREPWPEPRPTIVLFLDVTNSARTFALASDGEFGVDMRVALDTASDLVGLPVVLPNEETLAKLDNEIAALDAPALDHMAQTTGGDIALAGTLAWSDEALGWVAEWRLDHSGEDYRWSVSGVSFDAAFRNALRGAAQILSGNGAPG
jgi:uncharacterized protein